MDAFNEKFKKFYEENGEPEEALKKLLGHKSALRIRSWLRGDTSDPTTAELRMMSKFFKCSIDDLLWESLGKNALDKANLSNEQIDKLYFVDCEIKCLLKMPIIAKNLDDAREMANAKAQPKVIIESIKAGTYSKNILGAEFLRNM